MRSCGAALPQTDEPQDDDWDSGAAACAGAGRHDPGDGALEAWFEATAFGAPAGDRGGGSAEDGARALLSSPLQSTSICFAPPLSSDIAFVAFWSAREGLGCKFKF